MNSEASHRQHIDVPQVREAQPVIESCESCQRVRFGGLWSREAMRVADVSVRQAIVHQTICRDCLASMFPEYFAA